MVALFLWNCVSFFDFFFHTNLYFVCVVEICDTNLYFCLCCFFARVFFCLLITHTNLYFVCVCVWRWKVFEEKDKKDFLFFVFLGDFFFSSPQHESLFRLCLGVSQTRISIFVCVCFARVSALTHTNLYFVCVCFVVGVRGEKKKDSKKKQKQTKKTFFCGYPPKHTLLSSSRFFSPFVLESRLLLLFLSHPRSPNQLSSFLPLNGWWIRAFSWLFFVL